MKAEAINFRDFIFLQNTRRFGDVAELVMKYIFELNDSSNNAYDAEKNGERYEIKFSRVTKKHTEVITADNLIELIKRESFDERAIKFDKMYDEKFDSNIQQVKPAEFDWLIYGLFLADKVIIFKTSSENIVNLPGWTDKQHRGNVGEGQFHIKNTNLSEHLEHYLVKIMTYQEIYDLFA